MSYRRIFCTSLVLLLCALQCASQLPECLIMDPKDRLSFDWYECDSLQPMLTVKEYNVDLAIEAYQSDSLFALSTTGVGEFCIESASYMTISENLYSELVYRIENTSPQGGNLSLILLDYQNEVDYVYTLKDAGEWIYFDDWLLNRGVYKIQITVETFRADDLVVIEKLITTDLDSSDPVCRIFDKPTPTTTTEEVSSSTSTADTSSDSTTTDTSPLSSSSTTDESTTTESSETSTISSSSSTSPTIESSSSSTSSTTTTDPTTEATKPPPEEIEDDSKEELWMIIAIVFMSMFCLLLIGSTYFHFTTRHKMKSRGLPTKFSDPPITKTVPGRSEVAPPLSKLPRLYVDRQKDNPFITAHQKRV